MQAPREPELQFRPAVRRAQVNQPAPVLEHATVSDATLKPPPRSWRSITIGAAAAAVVAALGFGWHSLSGPSPDVLTPQQIAEMNASWSAATASGIQLDRVASADLQAAVAGMHLTPEAADALLQDLAAGRTSLVWVTVWDSMSEDGDVVALSSEGVRTVVLLKNAHRKIALPRPANGTIIMEGVNDGAGGGITVGIMSGDQPIMVSPMTPGQVIDVPVR